MTRFRPVLVAMACAAVVAGAFAARNFDETDAAQTATVEASGSRTPEEAYVDMVRRTDPDYWFLHSHDDLVAMGRSACRGLDSAGGDVNRMVGQSITDGSFVGHEFSYELAVGFAVPVFCPEYRDAFTVYDHLSDADR